MQAQLHPYARWSVAQRASPIPSAHTVDNAFDQGSHDYTPPVWPNATGEQQMMMHIDIAVEVLGGDGDPRARFFALVEHLESLGARRAEHQPQQDRVVVMLDPAGHPFCLVPSPMA